MAQPNKQSTPTPPATPKNKTPLCWCGHKGPANEGDHNGTDGMCRYNEINDTCDCGGYEPVR